MSKVTRLKDGQFRVRKSKSEFTHTTHVDEWDADAMDWQQVCKIDINAFNDYYDEFIADALRFAADDMAKQAEREEAAARQAERLEGVIDHIREVSDAYPSERVYVMAVTRTYWDAVRKMAMRRGAGYVGFKRHDGSILFVCDARLEGRDWRLHPTTLTRLQADLGRDNPIQRIDWCSAWRPTGRSTEAEVGA